MSTFLFISLINEYLLKKIFIIYKFHIIPVIFLTMELKKQLFFHSLLLLLLQHLFLLIIMV